MNNRIFRIKLFPQLFIFIALSVLSACASGQENNKEIVYQCPMKCEKEKTYEKPGKCPVCGMNLKKVEHSEHSKTHTSNVKIAGAMRNVMRKGELFGNILLDTISNKTHLYGLGPIEYLKGEILIIDGKSYLSKVVQGNKINVSESFNVKAPFFVFANVAKWKEVFLPDSISSIKQLQTYLEQTTKYLERPFAFRVIANVDNATFHILNLPDGAEVHSPEEVHKNQKVVNIKNQNVELIGFFSTEHAGIFTHHDSFVHIHLLTADKTKMGHLDKILLKKGTANLYLPE